MDHGGGGSGASMSHMSMVLFFERTGYQVLFESAAVNSLGAFAGAFLLCFAWAVFATWAGEVLLRVENAAASQLVVLRSAASSTVASVSDGYGDSGEAAPQRAKLDLPLPAGKDAERADARPAETPFSPSRVRAQGALVSAKRSAAIAARYALGGAAHALRLALHYFSMLLVMTMQVWLIVAVCVGHGVGWVCVTTLRAHVERRGRRSQRKAAPARDHRIGGGAARPAPAWLRFVAAYDGKGYGSAGQRQRQCRGGGGDDGDGDGEAVAVEAMPASFSSRTLPSVAGCACSAGAAASAYGDDAQQRYGQERRVCTCTNCACRPAQCNAREEGCQCC